MGSSEPIFANPEMVKKSANGGNGKMVNMDENI